MIELRTRLSVLLTSVLMLAALVLPASPARAAGVEVEVLGVGTGTPCDTGFVHVHNYNSTTGHTHLKICIH